MVLPGRIYNAGSYRYGFNGKEKDKDISEGSITFEARIYDDRIGRFFSTDPRQNEYSWQTPYAYFCNSPILIIDFNGEGDYYNKNGTHLGNDGKKDDKLYTANSVSIKLQEKRDASGKEILKDGKPIMEEVKVFEGAQLLNLKHSEFTRAVSIMRQEGDTKNPNEYIFIVDIFYNKAGQDPNELNNTLNNESSVTKDPAKEKKRFSADDNEIGILTTRGELLNRLTGGKDHTNGGTQNDGNDFFAWGLTRGKYHHGKHAKFVEYQTIIISKDIFIEITTNLKAIHGNSISFTKKGLGTMPTIEGVFLDKRNFDKYGNFIYHTGAKSGGTLTATKAAGETIFWKEGK